MSSGQPAMTKRFSEFATDDRPLAGEKVRIESILNQEILITGYRLTESKFSKSNSPKCLTVQFSQGEPQHVFFTGSSVLINQLEKYGEEIPFLTTIRKIERYYSLT
jgi:hypothetical protein